jgi:hypothetical protein
MSRALVILSSQQIWPNLQAILHYREQEAGLERLFIYHTADKEHSLGQAVAIEAFAKKYLGLPVTRFCGGIVPSDLGRILARWKSEYHFDRWIVNATGGIKLMTFGLFDVVDHPDTDVIYREMTTSKWYVVRRGMDNRIAATEMAVDEHLANDIPAVDVLRMQNPVASQHQLELVEAARLPIIRIVELGLETGWDWRGIFQRINQPCEEQPGILYEKFVAAVLLELGVKRVVLNATRKAGGVSLEELDVLAHHNGRVIFLDCKLRTHEEEKAGKIPSLASQIKEADENRRRYGGLHAQGVLIRPNRPFTEVERGFASSFSLRVIAHEDSRNLFNALSGILKMPLSDTLATAQRLLAEGRPGEINTFAPSDYAAPTAKKRSLANKLIAPLAEQAAKNVCGFTVQPLIFNWHLIAIDPRTGLDIENMKKVRTKITLLRVGEVSTHSWKHRSISMLLLKLDSLAFENTRQVLSGKKTSSSHLLNALLRDFEQNVSNTAGGVQNQQPRKSRPAGKRRTAKQIQKSPRKVPKRHPLIGTICPCKFNDYLEDGGVFLEVQLASGVAGGFMEKTDLEGFPGFENQMISCKIIKEIDGIFQLQPIEIIS